MSDLSFTHIYESARKKMGITRDEYALCNYVQTWSIHPDNPRLGWCNRTISQKAEWIGVTGRGLQKMQNRMIELGLLIKDSMTAHVRVSKTWFEIVNMEAQKNKEQSSTYSRPKTRNKVPSNVEQSSIETRNKVPTHNKYNKEEIESIVDDYVSALKAENENEKMPSMPAPPIADQPHPVDALSLQFSNNAAEVEMAAGMTKTPVADLLDMLSVFTASKKFTEESYRDYAAFKKNFLYWIPSEKARRRTGSDSKPAGRPKGEFKPGDRVRTLEPTTDYSRPQLF